MPRRHDRRWTDRGSTIPLIVGFVAVLLVAVAVVVDATAAFLERQSLDTLADGAALQGADLGAQGLEVYAGGLGGRRLTVSEQAARAAVAGYLTDTGAYRRYPGLRFEVTVGADRVVVRLRAPADLPLHVPGSPDRPVVGASGSAVVTVDGG
ncbi:hypothetical protein GCM10009798_26180 [Nocardioides panacihumi]|uniref:Putative Flp pilus-assembly TadG-like N-terminal domain-containing protein n=1 Tax=Nocardioides panacihumi TaxID=400774 RepID=A0ABN2R768_9ACTN